MKFFIMIILMLSVSFGFVSNSYAEEFEFDVYGMACSFCAYGLEKKVSKMENVESFTVDVTTGKATLVTQEGTPIDQEALRQVVRDSGLEMHTHGNDHKHDEK